jgi:hypothetical protein
MCTDPRRDCTSFHGKKGLKAQRCCSWKKIKSNNNTLPDARPRGLKKNEMFLLKILRTCKSKPHTK